MNYEISEKRLKYLIMEIIRNLEIGEIYRVQIEFPKGVTPCVVALFFEYVRGSEYQQKVKKEVEDTIRNILNFEPLVIIIPYSEAKFHLREPRNI
jgi:hypothetical protein